MAAALGARPSVPGSCPPEENAGRSSQYRNLGEVRRTIRKEPLCAPTISAPSYFRVSAPVFEGRDVCNLHPEISPNSRGSPGLKACPILLGHVLVSSSNHGSEVKGSDNVRSVDVGQIRKATKWRVHQSEQTLCSHQRKKLTQLCADQANVAPPPVTTSTSVSA
jgi:hypothetical protein